MQVCITDTSISQPTPDLRSAGDLAPDLARPWVVRMRYGMLAAQLALVVFLGVGLGERLLLGWLAVPLAITAITNLILRRKFVSSRNPQALLGELFCLDTVCLTVVLGLTGGPMNPFSLLYLVQIMLSAMVLNKTWTWFLGMLSTCAFGLLFWFSKPIAAFSPHHAESGLTLHLAGMWIAFTIAALLITFFIGKVSEAVRQHEREVLDLRDRLAKSQRLASLVTLSAGAAHELGTPLGTIAVVAKELERSLAQQDAPGSGQRLALRAALLDDAKLIRAEVARCRLILERMSADGAETPGEASIPVPLSQILAGVAARFERYPEFRFINGETDQILLLPREATVQAVSALVKNALDANIDHREVVLKAQIRDSQVRFVVEDKGAGMSPEVLSHLAEPFFTTKAPGVGMGLGTFLVRMFAEHLNGRLSFDSTPGKGSTAVLELPAMEPGNAPA
ncbi:MAG TPA: ATP-binding protein [Bryobacteraceae bacterium]|nr:ATP-binding protein [Bryobacteraceae bacterium]